VNPMSASCERLPRRIGSAALAFVVAVVPHASLAASQDPVESGEVAASEPVPERAEVVGDEDSHEPAGSDAADAHASEPEAASQDAERAEALAAFRDGTRSYELGRYEEAIAGFERAWELTEAPQLLYNIGQAYWKRFDVDPDLDHLRRARTFFRNYDKRMQGAEFYDANETKRVIEEIDAQIEEREALEAERNRPVITGPSLAEQEAELRRQLQREREYRATRAINGTGIALIVLGGASLVMGLAGLSTRYATGAVLDTSSGGSRGVNLASAEQDARRRRQYLVSGQVAFAGFVAGGIMLPIGITLRLVGRSRVRKGKGDPLEQEDSARTADPAGEAEPPRQSGISIGPSRGLLTVHF
jgi:tetratricopeptide (TPR) repeat protein